MEKLVNGEFKLNTEKNGISQTERNELKKETLSFIADKIGQIFPESDIYRVSEGVAVATYNEKLGETITFIVNATFKDFEFNPQTEEEAYFMEENEKAEAKAKKAEAKAKKIEQDKKIRAEKAKAKGE